GQLVSAERSLALLVVGPDARRRRARDVRAHHHLHAQRLALQALEDVRIRQPHEVALRDALRLLEPPRGETVQHLALERDRAEHAIERADAIGDDDEAPIAAAVVVADLSFVPLPEA